MWMCDKAMDKCVIQILLYSSQLLSSLFLQRSLAAPVGRLLLLLLYVVQCDMPLENSTTAPHGCTPNPQNPATMLPCTHTCFAAAAAPLTCHHDPAAAAAAAAPSPASMTLMLLLLLPPHLPS
jgi:hypothetical protein